MSAWLDDGDVRLYAGDALEQLALMPSESVQCAITSPPFYSLRDYGVDGQIGLEATLDEWLENLVAVFSELKRVLRSDGTFWLEIGDSYADKQLAGAPWRLAFALQEAGWFLRSDCIWARLPPNPMPESVTDRPTKAHSYVFLLSKSARYFYDADAIREPHQVGGKRETNGASWDDGDGEKRHGGMGPDGARHLYGHANGRNARSVWSIPTEPTPFAHFATFPQALVERCIKAGTSEHGACSECGAPWRRVTERERIVEATPSGNRELGRWSPSESDIGGRTIARHLGWEPSCACHDVGGPLWNGLTPTEADTTPCVVLDPFMGSGTTALVARRLGRHAIGIELNSEYLDIAADRLKQPTLWSEPV